MKTKDKILSIVPRKRTFGAHEVSKILYPHLERTDANGRSYNFGVATTARLLRTTKGIVELDNNIFYAW